MKITLATFQQNALGELRSNCETAQQLCKKNQCILSLSAPTGAGKTIIMANLIEDVLCGSAEYYQAADHGDGHPLLGPGEKGDMDGMLCKDVFSGWFHAGFRDAFGRESAQFHDTPSFQQFRGAGAGFDPGCDRFCQLYRAFA